MCALGAATWESREQRVPSPGGRSELGLLRWPLCTPTSEYGSRVSHFSSSSPWAAVDLRPDAARVGRAAAGGSQLATMGVSVLMVAEKPSLAQSISQILSNGQVRCLGLGEAEDRAHTPPGGMEPLVALVWPFVLPLALAIEACLRWCWCCSVVAVPVQARRPGRARVGGHVQGAVRLVPHDQRHRPRLQHRLPACLPELVGWAEWGMPACSPAGCACGCVMNS